MAHAGQITFVASRSRVEECPGKVWPAKGKGSAVTFWRVSNKDEGGGKRGTESSTSPSGFWQMRGEEMESGGEMKSNDSHPPLEEEEEEENPQGGEREAMEQERLGGSSVRSYRARALCPDGHEM